MDLYGVGEERLVGVRMFVLMGDEVRVLGGGGVYVVPLASALGIRHRCAGFGEGKGYVGKERLVGTTGDGKKDGRLVACYTIGLEK